MEDNTNNLEDTIIEDIVEDTLDTLDETLEQDQETEIAEAKKVKKEDNVGEDEDEDEDDCQDCEKDEDNIGEAHDKPGDEDSDIDNDGDSDEADAYLKNRRKAISKNMKEESDIIISDEISNLIESEEGLTEEFKEKASVIFEAAVTAKVNAIEASLQEQYETRLLEETETIKNTLEEQVDNYLTYAVETWMEDNKVAIESSLRTQMAENFISALKNVFVEHYVEVPDSKVDLFDQIEKENSNLKEEAAKANRIADALADRVDSLVREKVIAEASIGLADTQADKLKKLVEDVQFVDEETFAKKVATIKEFYLNGTNNVEETTLTESTDSYVSTETLIEEDSSQDVTPEMKAYLNALSRMNRAMTADLL